MKSQPWVSITSEICIWNSSEREINQSKVWKILAFLFLKSILLLKWFFSWNHAVRVYWIAFKSKQRQLVGETSYLKKILLSQSVSRQRLLWIEISIQKLANYLCETILFLMTFFHVLNKLQNHFWIMHPTGTYLGVLSKRENERMFILCSMDV